MSDNDLTNLQKLIVGPKGDVGPEGPPGPTVATGPSGGGSAGPLRITLYVDSTFEGESSNGSISAPYTSIATAYAASASLGSDCNFIIAPGTYSDAFTITGSFSRYAFVAAVTSSIPLVLIHGTITWEIQDGSEVYWEGCPLCQRA